MVDWQGSSVLVDDTNRLNCGSVIQIMLTDGETAVESVFRRDAPSRPFHLQVFPLLEFQRLSNLNG